MATQIMPQNLSFANAINAAIVEQGQTGQTLSMSSKEIAELTRKEHSNVLRDIRTMLVQLYDANDASDLNHQEIQGVTVETDTRGYMSLIYLDKDHTLTLLTGYDTKARLAVVRRWQELEGQVASTQSQQVTIVDPAFALMMQQLQVIGQQIQAMDAIKQRMSQLDESVKVVAEQVEESARQTEANTRQIQQIETATDHFTIIGWHRYAQQSGSLPLVEAAKMGRIATKFCKDHEIKTGTVPDPRFGTANTYPKWVLDSLFIEGHA